MIFFYIWKNLYYKKVSLVAAMTVSGLFSASVGKDVSSLMGIMSEKEFLETSKELRGSTNALPAQDCVPVTYHGCIHATTCISNFTFEKFDEWVERIEENYCNN